MGHDETMPHTVQFTPFSGVVYFSARKPEVKLTFIIRVSTVCGMGMMDICFSGARKKYRIFLNVSMYSGTFSNCRGVISVAYHACIYKTKWPVVNALIVYNNCDAKRTIGRRFGMLQNQGSIEHVLTNFVQHSGNVSTVEYIRWCW